VSQPAIAVETFFLVADEIVIVIRDGIHRFLIVRLLVKRLLLIRTNQTMMTITNGIVLVAVMERLMFERT